MKTLIIYYSLEGNTRSLAEAMAHELGADTLEICPKKSIPKKGFLRYAWGGGQVVMNKHVDLEPYTVDVHAYDRIIIGTPVWASSAAQPMRAFLEKETIAGKKVACFCTHQGMAGRTLGQLKKQLHKNTIIGERDFVMLSQQGKEKARDNAIDWAADLPA